jgi:hypothetical protein
MNTPWNIADQVITISMDNLPESKKNSPILSSPQTTTPQKHRLFLFRYAIRAGRFATKQLVPQIQQKYRSKFYSLINSITKISQ